MSRYRNRISENKYRLIRLHVDCIKFVHNCNLFAYTLPTVISEIIRHVFYVFNLNYRPRDQVYFLSAVLPKNKMISIKAKGVEAAQIIEAYQIPSSRVRMYSAMIK